MIDRSMWPLTFSFAAKLSGFALFFMLLVHAQQVDDQSGFISIDCGLADNSSYSVKTTKIKYISDAKFIDTGERQTVSYEYIDFNQQPYHSLRSFSQGRRNCYRINVTSGIKYLIRASFLYGNYDGQKKLPQFQLHLGPNLWDTVRLDDVSTATIKELIHYVPVVQNYIHVCLVSTGSGVPFISVLELRPLPNSTYPEQKNNSLALVRRHDTGGNGAHRYLYDKLDRVWNVYYRSDWSQLNTSVDMIGSDYSSQPPSIVMKSAVMPKNRTGSVDVNLEYLFFEGNAKHHNYFYFAEVEKLSTNQSRLQYISKDGELFHEPFALSYLETTTIYWHWSSTPNTSISISKADNSTLPPILNAFEIYSEVEFSLSETNQEDFDAIIDIKSAYEIKRNWQGDPCVPQDYLWEGVRCSYHENELPRIISLNLSSSGLTGEIPPSIFNLTMIQTMDLSNNNLTGSIPELFSQLSKLNTLNLEKNNLSGSIPGELIERRKHGLSLSLCENPNLFEQVSCKKKKRNINIIPVAGSIFGILMLLSTVAAVLWGFKMKRQHEMIKKSIPNWSVESEGPQFTYSELVKITNNFASIIGSGGFGTVYHGTLKDGIQVAVKLLTSSSGSKEFQNEVKLLMRAHHRNLVSLIGNCYEGDTMALIFEYVNNGTLEQHISAVSARGKNFNVLTWKERLQIAVDAARGLDYLHNGCMPPIVHRDLKTSNILLNERMQAKICDFGISKVISMESATHTMTDHIKGTRGYFDPEYYTTGNLNKKSDIYSFGIVLLELITGKPAIIIDIEAEPIHICEWVRPTFERMEIESIVDSRLQGTYDNSSVWKATEIAMACVASATIQRPDIIVVSNELKKCLEIEVPPEIPKMPEIEDSDDRTSNSSGSIYIMSHIECETERHYN